MTNTSRGATPGPPHHASGTALQVAEEHLRLPGIGIILGVDRVLDIRTTVNVTGDLAAAVVVSRGEPR
jgi:Na+/H+-dicarboxylate symporter